MTKRRWPMLVLGAAAISVIGADLPAWATASAPVPLTEHFLVVETSPTATTFPVSATGPIHELGKDVVLSDTKDRFVFKKGALNVTHKPKSQTQHFDKATCTGRFAEKGSYTVTGGSGAYAKASGSGTYSVVGYVIGCNPKKPPTTISVVIQASGPLHLKG
jgi:hypothetical protein